MQEILNHIEHFDFKNVRERKYEMTWKKFSEEIPPLGKRILVKNEASNKIHIMTLKYVFLPEEQHNFDYSFEETDLKEDQGHWMLLPELPEEIE